MVRAGLLAMVCLVLWFLLMAHQGDASVAALF